MTDSRKPKSQKGIPKPNWEPNSNQLTALRHAQERNFIFSIPELANLLDISRQAIHGWNDCPGYLKWWSQEREKFFKARLDKVYGASYERSVGDSDKGDTKDAKLLMERFDQDYAPASRREISGADGGPVKTYINVNVADVIGGGGDGGEEDGQRS